MLFISHGGHVENPIINYWSGEICRGGHGFHWISIKITNCQRVHIGIVFFWEDAVNVQRWHPPAPTTDAKWWNKLTWPIGSGELKRMRTCLLELMHLEITCLLHSGKVVPGGPYWFCLVNGILTQVNVYTFWKTLVSLFYSKIFFRKSNL